MSSHLPIEQTDIYVRVVAVADQVWEIVDGWPKLAQDTVGKQWIRAIDSVGANLVEGDGRYSDADALHFFTIARGSLREAIYWLERAYKRNLVTLEHTNDLNERLDHSIRALNSLISYRRNRQKSDRVKEHTRSYVAMDGLPGDPNTEHRPPNTEH